MRLTILFLLSLCFYSASYLQAQVTTDPNFATVESFPATDPVEISNFTVPSGDNRVLIVAVGSNSNNFPTSVTYGAMSMTQAVLEDAFMEVSMWYLTLGSGAAIGPSDIVANTGIYIGAVSFQNVDQTSVFANPTQDSDDIGSNSSSLSVPTTDVKNLVVDAFMSNADPIKTAIHTEIGNNFFLCMGSAVGTGGNVNVEWALNSGTTVGQAHVAIELIGLECTAPSLSYDLIESSGASDDDAILCATSPITFEVTANEGASPYTYKWASSSTTGSILNSLAPPFAGTFIEYVTVTDANSCSSTIAIPFTVNPLPMPIATSNGLVLEGEDFNLMEIGGGVSYWSWSGPNNFSSTLQNPTVYAATKSAEGDYVVTVTNTENCSGTSATSVIVESIADVPTLSEWGLIILALLLMTAGTLYLVQPTPLSRK